MKKRLLFAGSTGVVFGCFLFVWWSIIAVLGVPSYYCRRRWLW
jgi:hypothetical protein